MSNSRLTSHSLDTCDCRFMLTVFDQIFQSNEMIIDQKSNLPLLPLKLVYELEQDLLGRWSGDVASECSKSIRALDTCGPRDTYVMCDEVVTIFVESFGGVRSLWEEHIRYLGKRNCSVFRVVSELTYSKDTESNREDGEGVARDVVLNKVRYSGTNAFSILSKLPIGAGQSCSCRDNAKADASLRYKREYDSSMVWKGGL